MIINFKRLMFHIFLPILAGGISGILLPGSQKIYENIKKPPFSPTSLFYSTGWIFFYVLMGAAAYRISSNLKSRRIVALKLYYIQLAISVIWAFFFFQLGLYFVSIIILIILWGILCATILQFSLIDNWAMWLIIPYSFYITYTAYMNMGVTLLNH